MPRRNRRSSRSADDDPPELEAMNEISMYDELLRKINELSEHVKQLESRNDELEGRLSRATNQSNSDESISVANVGYIINKENIPLFKAEVPASQPLKRNTELEGWLRQIENLTRPQNDDAFIRSAPDFFRLIYENQMTAGQAPLDFYLQLEGAIYQGYRDYPNAIGEPDELIRRVFLQGLPGWLREVLALKEGDPLPQVVDAAQRVWNTRVGVRHHDGPSQISLAPREPAMARSRPHVAATGEQLSKFCSFHKSHTHNTRECRAKRDARRCFNCSRDWAHSESLSLSDSPGNRLRPTSPGDRNGRKIRPISDEIKSGRPIIKLRVNGIIIDCFVDSGSEATIVKSEAMSLLRIKKQKGLTKQLRGVSGNMLTVDAEWRKLPVTYTDAQSLCITAVSDCAVEVSEADEVVVVGDGEDGSRQGSDSVEDPASDRKEALEENNELDEFNDDFDEYYGTLDFGYEDSEFTIFPDIDLRPSADATVYDPILGHVPGVEHRIVTNDSDPICVRQWRLPEKTKAFIRDECDKMRDEGVIEPSSSPWLSPVVLVRKKNGTQFCIDFRGLNAATLADSYPMPRIDELIDELRDTSWFTVLDAKNAYWSISVAPEDRPKTAFSDGHRLWQFRRLPFGLATAPSTFQRTINMVLSAVLGRHTVAYLDDVVVHSSSFEEHLEHLTETLHLLNKAGFRLNREKCEFATREFKFLGFKVTPEEFYRTLTRSLPLITALLPVLSKRCAQISGCSGYFRKHIPNYAALAAPLTRLTRKDAKFVWTDEEEKAFNTLKQSLVEAPVLKKPNFTSPFEVHCDASKLALGACLMQRGPDDIPHAVAYFSRKLRGPETRYPAIDMKHSL
ncbi:uncharacterized protein LOC119568907 [Penaeus monodon]|uniref:uncharacterized protein LOC119568907 n=1 Tax=Penaeus monodon TaxID=6687 RepID=UPI0018A73786|nr:uncharacterized protein LOC119568907 [Penaeus monodon]